MLDANAVDYETSIPNNVGLSSDRRVLKALEKWHPGYLSWWNEMGPEGFQDSLVYLRTAVGVEPGGWAKFDYVRMPEYRWGVLLAPKEENRLIGFGQHKGQPAWQEVPGEYRAMLQRLCVIQGDTEPASVEQQRHLGTTAPSLYDMRNLFQVNVEEARHLWAMVYLLQKYFGKEGRSEAEGLLIRRSGDEDRVIQRTCDAMNQAGIENPFDIDRIRALGVIDLPTIQKKANLHYSLSLDLFGSEISTNAATAFNNSLKGRYREDKIEDDHQLINATYPVLKPVDGTFKLVDEPALTALNMRLRDDYTRETDSGVRRWNRQINKNGIDFEIRLPSVSFNRSIGLFSNIDTTPEGDSLTQEEFLSRKDHWLPSADDGAFVSSLMEQVIEPGSYAGWISPPRIGIDNKAGDFEYVRLQ